MVLVFAESQNGVYKKGAHEAIYYGYKVAQKMGTNCQVLVLGSAEAPEALGNYGAEKVHSVQHDHLNQFDSQVYAEVIAAAMEQLGAEVLVMASTANGKSLLGRLAVKCDAGSVSGAIALPEVTDEGHFLVKKGVFSSKAIGTFQISSAKKLISVMGNALQPEIVGNEVSVEPLDLEVPAPKVKVKKVDRVTGVVPLPEAELVVSGGRGFKGPENWQILLDLAEALGATTACSRPVADADWRPHHEHVGQTGVAIRPNLYIAIGISGAIQHLAGVNNSKVIVVINKDSEAPFFKAAHYGVVGDLFDVVPRLTEAVKRFQG